MEYYAVIFGVGYLIRHVIRARFYPEKFINKMVHLRPKFLNLGLAIPLFDFLVSWSRCTPSKEEATVTNTHNLSCGVNVIL